MNLSNSRYYNSLPPAIRESIASSRVVFENEEEMNMYLKNAGSMSVNSFSMGYPYLQGFAPFLPWWHI